MKISKTQPLFVLRDKIPDKNWRDIWYNERLSEDFIVEHMDHADAIDWKSICSRQYLSEEFIEKFADKVDWCYISMNQKLSEEFIARFADKVDWAYVSIDQILSEEFIERFAHKVDWKFVSREQKLSEEFIEKWEHRVNWYVISGYQKLSESFILKHKDKLNCISLIRSQHLNEDFIYDNFINNENHSTSSLEELNRAHFTSNKVSNEFIKKHYKRILPDYMDVIAKYQKLNDDKGMKFYKPDSKNNWLYASKEEKMKVIREKGKYEIQGDYIIAYKGIRHDYYSCYNFQFKYEVGETYESHADFNLGEENSFGLSAWTLEDAYYFGSRVVKVKIHIDDIAACVHCQCKLRCTKFKILEEVDG